MDGNKLDEQTDGWGEQRGKNKRFVVEEREGGLIYEVYKIWGSKRPEPNCVLFRVLNGLRVGVPIILLVFPRLYS